MGPALRLISLHILFTDTRSREKNQQRSVIERKVVGIAFCSQKLQITLPVCFLGGKVNAITFLQEECSFVHTLNASLQKYR